MRSFYQSQQAAASKLFSSAVFQELARKGRSSLFSSLFAETGLGTSLGKSARVGDAFEEAFDRLCREGSRDEYIYKTALIRRVLLGRHSLKTACALNEFRVGECKADLAILNGTSTVYEVKSERDSLVRLDKQLGAYSLVFASVYVVSAETHLKKLVSSMPEHVGLLRVNNRFQISIVREAIDRSADLSVPAIFDSIRLEEAQRILSYFGVETPVVPNTELCSVLREHFLVLNPHQAHEGMVRILKDTRSHIRLSDLLRELPRSLHTAALSAPLRKLDHSRLISAVNTDLQVALGWR